MVAYSQIDRRDLTNIVFGKTIQILLTTTDGIFTGCPKAKIKDRKARVLTAQRWSASSKRGHLILEALGEKSRSSSGPLLLAAAVTKPKKSAAGGKIKGAKATKKLGKLLSKGHILEPEEATAFRALSARGS